MYSRKSIPTNFSVEEHYREEEKQREVCLKKQKRDKEGGVLRGWCGIIYHYECTACGHKNVSMNKRMYGL